MILAHQVMRMIKGSNILEAIPLSLSLTLHFIPHSDQLVDPVFSLESSAYLSLSAGENESESERERVTSVIGLQVTRKNSDNLMWSVLLSPSLPLDPQSI